MKPIFLLPFGVLIASLITHTSFADKDGWLRNGTGQIIGSDKLEGRPAHIHGEYLHSLEPDGTVVTQGANQRVDGKIVPPGFICPHDTPTASYEQDGMIRNRQGQVIGEVSRDGTVLRSDGQVIAIMPASPAGRAVGAMILVNSQDQH